MLKRAIVLFFVFGLLLILSFNKHSKDKEKSYHGVIWADAAGYYVYNPIWFIYGNNAKAVPDSIFFQVGEGFKKDTLNNKILTKYYSGTAILEVPFFLAAHLLSKPLGYESNGFSKIYSYSLYISGVFYFLFGSLFLYFFLVKHFSSFISIFSITSFFICTNLYYYTIDAPGMSHIYSFFVFSAFMYVSSNLFEKQNFKMFFLLLFLAVLIRPTNIFIGLFPFFYNSFSISDVKNKLSLFISNYKKIIYSVFIASILFIPQLFYWKITSGNFLNYSYGNEGFDFLSNPRLAEVWFSPNNGLFLYAPILILSLIGVGVMIKHKSGLGIYFAFLFLLTSYIFASWWNWWFGCSLGARSFVDYYPFYIFSFAYLFNSIAKYRIIKFIFMLLVLFFGIIYMNIEYYYDGCFYGSTWDFATFLKLI